MYVVTYDYRAGDVSPQRHPLCLPPCVTEVAPGVPLLCRCRAVPGSTPGTPVGASSKGDDSEQLLGQTGWRLDYMCVWGGERNILRISALGHVQCLFPQVLWASLEVAGQGLCADLAPGRCSSPPHPAPQPTWEGKRGLQTHAPLTNPQDPASWGRCRAERPLRALSSAWDGAPSRLLSRGSACDSSAVLLSGTEPDRCTGRAELSCRAELELGLERSARN